VVFAGRTTKCTSGTSLSPRGQSVRAAKQQPARPSRGFIRG